MVLGISSAPSQAGGDHRHELRLAAAGVLEVVWQVGVERDRVALARGRARRRRRRAAARPVSTTAVSRLPGLVHRRVVRARRWRRRRRACAARPRRAGRAAAASAPRSGGRRAWPPSRRSSARTTVTPSPSSSRSSCERRQLEAGGDLGRHRERRAGLARARPGTASAPRRRCARRGRAARGPSPRAAPGRAAPTSSALGGRGCSSAAYVITYVCMRLRDEDPCRRTRLGVADVEAAILTDRPTDPRIRELPDRPVSAQRIDAGHT